MKNRNAGFTISELLIAIFLIGIIITGVFTIFSSADRTQQRTLLLEAATRAGQQQIESLRNNDYSSLVPGQVINFTSTLPSTLPSDKSGTVTVSEPKAGLRRVDILITYTSHGRDERVELSSFIGILGITQ